jgi:hypothetical protein
MHLGLGITIHLIGIFNACIGIYFYSLFKNIKDKKETQREQVDDVKFTKDDLQFEEIIFRVFEADVESDTKRNLSHTIIFISVLLLITSIVAMIIDLRKNLNYDYYGTPKTTSVTFIELPIIMLQIILILVIVYNKKIGLLHLSSNHKERTNIVALIALKLVFISYITIILFYKLLQNFDLVD